MDNKENYSAQEAAEMCKSYKDIGDAPTTHEKLKEHEMIVPGNVRDLVFLLDEQERAEFKKALDKK